MAVSQAAAQLDLPGAVGGTGVIGDPANCGAQGNACDRPEAAGVCIDDVCQYSCLPGFHDLNFDLPSPAGDGCEYGSCIQIAPDDSTCDAVDDDCDGAVDEDVDFAGVENCGACGAVCRAVNATPMCDGGTCGHGPCDSGFADLDPAVEGCEYECPVFPPLAMEECNGIDDDCDGIIDELPIAGLGTACGPSEPGDTGECAFGILECSFGVPMCSGYQGPGTEACDGLDNDCDGVIDNGFIANQCCGGAPCDLPNAVAGCNEGVCYIDSCAPGFSDDDGLPGNGCETGSCQDNVEMCNGLDDDCDGLVDEDFPDLGQSCNNGYLGACNADGTMVCSDDFTHTICSAPNLSPNPEICNGLDDDCDGQTDEVGSPPPDGLGPPIGESCGPPGCSPGTYQCVAVGDPMTAAEIQCVGVSGGFPEICNGLDDDCDMLIDEDIAGVGEFCYPYDGGCDPESGTCLGQCELGTLACRPPDGMVCEGAKGPSSEICIGQDNDCDGVIDDNALCPDSSQACFNGLCQLPCEEGPFPCPFDFECATVPPAICPQGDPLCQFCLFDLFMLDSFERRGLSD